MTVLQTRQASVLSYRLFALRIPFTWLTLTEHLRLGSGVTSTQKLTLIPPLTHCCQIWCGHLFCALLLHLHCLYQLSHPTPLASPFAPLGWEQLDSPAWQVVQFPPGAIITKELSGQAHGEESTDLGRKLNQIMKCDFLVHSERIKPLIDNAFAKSRHQRLASISQIVSALPGTYILTPSKELFNLEMY